MSDNEQLKYKHLAFLVLRDALAFYLGIPKFLEEENLIKILSKAIQEREKELRLEKERELTPKEKARCLRVTRLSLNLRIKELKIDLAYAKEILFEDNVWLQHLNLNEDFFFTYLSRLDEKTKNELAVVPKWKTKDHSLGRPYINDNFNFEGF